MYVTRLFFFSYQIKIFLAAKAVVYVMFIIVWHYGHKHSAYKIMANGSKCLLVFIGQNVTSVI